MSYQKPFPVDQVKCGGTTKRSFLTGTLYAGPLKCFDWPVNSFGSACHADAHRIYFDDISRKAYFYKTRRNINFILAGYFLLTGLAFLDGYDQSRHKIGFFVLTGAFVIFLLGLATRALFRKRYESNLKNGFISYLDRDDQTVNIWRGRKKGWETYPWSSIDVYYKTIELASLVSRHSRYESELKFMFVESEKRIKPLFKLHRKYVTATGSAADWSGICQFMNKRLPLPNTPMLWNTIMDTYYSDLEAHEFARQYDELRHDYYLGLLKFNKLICFRPERDESYLNPLCPEYTGIKRCEEYRDIARVRVTEELLACRIAGIPPKARLIRWAREMHLDIDSIRPDVLITLKTPSGYSFDRNIVDELSRRLLKEYRFELHAGKTFHPRVNDPPWGLLPEDHAGDDDSADSNKVTGQTHPHTGLIRIPLPDGETLADYFYNDKRGEYF